MENKVKEQILAIRDTGETNMFDLTRVREIALRKGFYELLNYLDHDPNAYVRFILVGSKKL
jgi:hypothetical protein